MIRVESLEKRFRAPASAGRLRWAWGRASKADPATGEVQAVRGLGFTAADGAITGLLGPNGAGKTTTLRIVAGLLEADAGRVEVDGLDVARNRSAALARLGVLSDSRGLYPRLTARENIVYFARLQGLDEAAAQARVAALSSMLELGALLERRTEGFSQGERMKTALARALVHDPPNIVLDEPTNGLDVLATRSLRQVLRRLRDDEGKCIVFSTHIMQEVERLCDEVVVVARGTVVAEGTVAALCARTGAADFEDAFVKLAFPDAADEGTQADPAKIAGRSGRAGPAAEPSAPGVMR